MFEASLTAAQVLLPGSQASISSMLLEGHSLLALSTIMFRPGGIDQVNVRSASVPHCFPVSSSSECPLRLSRLQAVREGERGQDPLSRVDPQLLRMALSAYPKLRTALFPPSGPRGTAACDTSLYHLMQVLLHFDTLKCFVMSN